MNEELLREIVALFREELNVVKTSVNNAAAFMEYQIAKDARRDKIDAERLAEIRAIEAEQKAYQDLQKTTMEALNSAQRFVTKTQSANKENQGL